MIKSINIDGKKLNTINRRKKADAVQKEMLTIMQSNLFRKMIYEMPDAYRQGCSKNCKLKNKSNFELYDCFMEGSEEWDGKIDHEADLQVDDYYSIARVIGHMIPGKKTIWVNTKYFDSMSRKKVGSNFIHEWTHTLGARHSGPFIRYSIPYWMNYVYDTCYGHLILNRKPDIEYMGKQGKLVLLSMPTPNEYVVDTFRKNTVRVYDVPA